MKKKMRFHFILPCLDSSFSILLAALFLLSLVTWGVCTPEELSLDDRRKNGGLHPYLPSSTLSPDKYPYREGGGGGKEDFDFIEAVIQQKETKDRDEEGQDDQGDSRGGAAGGETSSLSSKLRNFSSAFRPKITSLYDGVVANFGNFLKNPFMLSEDLSSDIDSSLADLPSNGISPSSSQEPSGEKDAGVHTPGRRGRRDGGGTHSSRAEGGLVQQHHENRGGLVRREKEEMKRTYQEEEEEEERRYHAVYMNDEDLGYYRTPKRPRNGEKLEDNPYAEIPSSFSPHSQKDSPPRISRSPYDEYLDIGRSSSEKEEQGDRRPSSHALRQPQGLYYSHHYHPSPQLQSSFAYSQHEAPATYYPTGPLTHALPSSSPSPTLLPVARFPRDYFSAAGQAHQQASNPPPTSLLPPSTSPSSHPSPTPPPLPPPPTTTTSTTTHGTSPPSLSSSPRAPPNVPSAVSPALQGVSPSSPSYAASNLRGGTGGGGRGIPSVSLLPQDQGGESSHQANSDVSAMPSNSSGPPSNQPAVTAPAPPSPPSPNPPSPPTPGPSLLPILGTGGLNIFIQQGFANPYIPSTQGPQGPSLSPSPHIIPSYLHHQAQHPGQLPSGGVYTPGVGIGGGGGGGGVPGSLLPSHLNLLQQQQQINSSLSATPSPPGAGGVSLLPTSSSFVVEPFHHPGGAGGGGNGVFLTPAAAASPGGLGGAFIPSLLPPPGLASSSSPWGTRGVPLSTGPSFSTSSTDSDRWWRGAESWPEVKPMTKKEIEEGLREISRHVASVRIEAHLGRSQVNAAKALSQYIPQGRLYDLQDISHVSPPITVMRGKILGFGAYGAVVEFLHSSPSSTDWSSPTSVSSSLSNKGQSAKHLSSSSSQQKEREIVKKRSSNPENEQREREKREDGGEEEWERGAGGASKERPREDAEMTKEEENLGNKGERSYVSLSGFTSDKTRHEKSRTPFSEKEGHDEKEEGETPPLLSNSSSTPSSSTTKRRNSVSHSVEEGNAAGVPIRRSASSSSSSSSHIQGKSVSNAGVRYAAKIFHWSKKRHPKMDEVEKTFESYIEEELHAFKQLRRIPKRSLERRRKRRIETNQGDVEKEEEDIKTPLHGDRGMEEEEKKKRRIVKQEDEEEGGGGVISDQELFLKYGLVVPLQGVREVVGLPPIFQANPALYPGDVPLFFSNRLIMYPALKCSLDMLLQSSNLSSSYHSFSQDSKRVLLRRIVSLVAGLHDLGFTHDDIKPQNFLVSLKGDLYLGDFAYLIPIDTVQDCNKGFTIDYTPPELMECALKNGSLPMSTYRDSWAVGVSGYQILCKNALPFFLDKKFGTKAEPKQVATYIASLQEKDLETSRCGTDYDKEAMSYVLRLLQPNRSKRATVEDLMKEPFFAMPEAGADEEGGEKEEHDQEEEV